MYNNREVIISKLMPTWIIDELKKLGYTPKSIEPSSNLTSELRYHPDILTFKLPGGRWIYENAHIRLGNIYPNDCIFNCAQVGNMLVYGNDYIAKHYGHLYEKLVHVKQGYVKCSLIILSDKAVITSDPSIFKMLSKDKNLDVLKITNDGIGLNGYNCGFIGGASGVLDKTIVFTGCIKNHRDYHDIKAFSTNYGINLYSLAKAPLYDYGGILCNF